MGIHGPLFERLMQRIEGLGPPVAEPCCGTRASRMPGRPAPGIPPACRFPATSTASSWRSSSALRGRAGWEIPWFVAEATYHSEQDPADEEFRAAQRALWQSKIALEGPDTDALRKEYRTGVHFNAKGLQAHGHLWAAKVGVWLDNTLSTKAR